MPTSSFRIVGVHQRHFSLPSTGGVQATPRRSQYQRVWLAFVRCTSNPEWRRSGGPLWQRRLTAQITLQKSISIFVVASLILIFSGWELALSATRSTSAFEAPITHGYGVVNAAGTLATFGGAGYHGDAPSTLAGSIVAVAATPDEKGYWMVSSIGEVYGYGDATYYGSASRTLISGTIAGMAATSDGKGYWLASSTGEVFAFGDASSLGSETPTLSGSSIVAITSTHDGEGYWLVSSTGEVYSYGNASYYGSASRTLVSGTIVGMTAAQSGEGYWLVSSAGQVFAFGAVGAYGSMVGQTVAAPIVGIAATGDGLGYVLVSSDGDVLAFGDAIFEGSDVNPAEPPNEPAGFADADPRVVGITDLAPGPQSSSSGPVKVTYFGDSLSWLDEIYSSKTAARYDEEVADASTPGCGIVGDSELSTTNSGVISPPQACADWYQRMSQALASEHPDVVVVELGYWESQPHLWDGTWATVADNSDYAAALSDNLNGLITLIRSYGAIPVLLTSPYYGDGTSNAEVDAWNSIVRGTAYRLGLTDLNLNSELDPTGAFDATVDGVDTRTTDGVHLTAEGVTDVIDPWLLPIVETLGLSNAERRSG